MVNESKLLVHSFHILNSKHSPVHIFKNLSGIAKLAKYLNWQVEIIQMQKESHSRYWVSSEPVTVTIFILLKEGFIITTHHYLGTYIEQKIRMKLFHCTSTSSNRLTTVVLLTRK